MCFAPQRRAIFSRSELQKLLRTWCVLFILTWKCASRHRGVPFFIPLLNSYLSTRRLTAPTFRTQPFATFLVLIFFLLTCLLFNCPYWILSDVTLLNFLRQGGWWKFCLVWEVSGVKGVWCKRFCCGASRCLELWRCVSERMGLYFWVSWLNAQEERWDEAFGVKSVWCKSCLVQKVFGVKGVWCKRFLV